VESLLGSNAAAEITQAEYEAALPQTQGGPQQ
jgi:hypothetical protein